MRLTYLRGGCVIVEAGGVHVLMDPWLTDGEYYGAWAHYPPFAWDLADNMRLSAIDYIYVSHIHPDHFSVETMKRLPKVPVLIHRFHSPFLRRNIEALGFEVIELPHGERFALNRGSRFPPGSHTSITIYAADDCDPEVCARFFGCTLPEVKNTQLDSMCVVEGDGKVLLNVNDCPYQLSKAMLPKLRLQYPQIDLLLVAYAGAGPYPQCFTMDDELKAAHAQLKKKMFIDHVRMFAEDTKAKVTFPFAGDYVLQGRLASLNPFRGVAKVEEVFNHLFYHKINCLELDPGGSYIVGKRPPFPPEVMGLGEWERQNYIDTVLRRRKLDYEDDAAPDGAELRALMLEAARRLHAKREEVGFASQTVMYIDTGHGLGRIPLDRTAAPTFEIKPREEPFILLQTDPRLLHRILSGPRYAHWNNAEIGSHITFTRRPDVFERGISQIVSYLHA